MAKEIMAYKFYKKLKTIKAQEKWLMECYHQIIDLEIVKDFTKNIKRGFFISRAKGSYGNIRANIEQQINERTKEKRIVSVTFISIGINIKETAESNKNLSHLIDTFAHEIAHQAHWDHSRKHDIMTKRIAKLIKSEMRANEARKILNKLGVKY